MQRSANKTDWEQGLTDRHARTVEAHDLYAQAEGQPAEQSCAAVARDILWAVPQDFQVVKWVCDLPRYRCSVLLLQGLLHDEDCQKQANPLEQHAEDSEQLELNEIGLSSIRLTDSIALDHYRGLPQTGAFIIIDRHTNVTVGAGMIEPIGLAGEEPARIYSQAEKDLNAYVRKHFPEWGCGDI